MKDNKIILNKSKWQLRKDTIKVIDTEKYILKKDSDHWINLWIWIAIAFFVCGVAVSEGYYANKSNDYIQDTLDEIGEMINERKFQNKFYNNQNVSIDINNLLDNKIQEQNGTTEN